MPRSGGKPLAHEKGRGQGGDGDGGKGRNRETERERERERERGREGERESIIIVLHFCLSIIVTHRLSPSAKCLGSTDNVLFFPVEDRLVAVTGRARINDRVPSERLWGILGLGSCPKHAMKNHLVGAARRVTHHCLIHVLINCKNGSTLCPSSAPLNCLAPPPPRSLLLA